MNFHSAIPVLRVSRTSLAGPLLLDHVLDGLGEGGYAHGSALLSQWIAARASEIAVGEGPLPLAVSNDEALDPVPGSRPPQVEV